MCVSLDLLSLYAPSPLLAAMGPLLPGTPQEEQADVLQHQPDGWMCQGLCFSVPVSDTEICLFGADLNARQHDPWPPEI